MTYPKKQNKRKLKKKKKNQSTTTEGFKLGGGKKNQETVNSHSIKESLIILPCKVDLNSEYEPLVFMKSNETL